MTFAKRITVALIPLLLAGCLSEEKVRDTTKEEKPVPEYPAVTASSVGDYYPHEPGTTWTYHVGVNGPPTSAQSFEVKTVAGETGPDSFGVEAIYTGQDVRGRDEYQIRDGKLLLVKSGDSVRGVAPVEPAKPLLVLPLEQDKTWSWSGVGESSLGKIMHQSHFRVDTGITLEARVGKFHVIRVEETQTPTDPSLKGTRTVVATFYAPGYGMVKQVTRRVDQQQRRGQTITIELATSSLLRGKGKPTGVKE